MDYTALLQMDNRRWNRKILNAFWVAVAISVVVECVNMTFSHDDWRFFLVRYILLPTILQVIIVGLTELAVALAKLPHDYLLLVSADLIAVVLIVVHSTIPVITATIILPVLISAFYFEPKKVIYSVTLSGVSLAFLVLWDRELQQSPMGVVTVFAIIVGGCYISIEVMHKGRAVLGHLRASIEANQNLMVNNIMMESLSKMDGLTDTYNHKSFHVHLDELVEQADQRGGAIHLLLFDIDNFKRINDTYGHHIGDVILRRVADCMKDQVTDHDFVARYGGEEFVVIIVNKPYSEAITLGENIRAAVADMNHDEIGGQAVTVSAGLSEYIRGEGKEALFIRADNHLYEAKHSGKNNLVCDVNG